MLKPQDIVIALKILAKQEQPWSQGGLAVELGMSASEVNGGIKRAIFSGLLQKKHNKVIPNKKALEEFILHGLKYVFPAERGEPTRGLAAAYAAPVFQGQFVIGEELPPVWPYAEGDVKGFDLKPLYKCVPFAVKNDPVLYDYMAIVDALRSGRVREVAAAQKLLKNILK